MSYDYAPYPYKPSEAISVGKTEFKPPAKDNSGIRLSPEAQKKIDDINRARQQEYEEREAKRLERKRRRDEKAKKSNNTAYRELKKLRQEWERLKLSGNWIYSRRSNEEWASYSEYINSAVWDEKRKRILQRDGYACKICGFNKFLNVHHLHYDNIFDEKDEDLLTVCEFCHKEIHIHERTMYCDLLKAFEYVQAKYCGKPRTFEDQDHGSIRNETRNPLRGNGRKHGRHHRRRRSCVAGR